MIMQKEKRSRATTGAGRRQQYSSTAIISILLSSLVVVDVVRTSYAHDTNNNGRAKLSNNDERRNANIINNAINRNIINNDENNKNRIRRTRGERRELNNIFLPKQHPQEEVSSTKLLQLNKYRIDSDSLIAEREDGDSNTNSGNDENNKSTHSKVMPDLRIINGVVVSTYLVNTIYFLFYLN